MRSRRYLFLYVIVLSVVMTGFGCRTNPATGQKQLVFISRDEEIALGKEAAPQFEEQFGGKIANEAVQQYVREIGLKLAASSDREMPYEFAVLASDIPNAFALPGGRVYITAGLLRLMGNERQLAGVLGHEIGHITALHSVQGMQRQMGAAILIEVAKSAAGGKYGVVAGGAAKVTSALVNLRYSRDQEYQADELGVRYARRAGYNPWGVVELLYVLEGLSKSEPGFVGQMLRTHPVTSKRIERAEALVREEHSEFSSEQRDPRVKEFVAIQGMLPAAAPPSQ